MSSTIRPIRFAVFSAVLAMLATIAAQAQKPVLSRNVDEPGRTPYFSESSLGRDCQVSCAFVFKPVPANYRLVVTYTSVAYHNEYPGGGSIRLHLGYQVSFGGDFYKGSLPVATPLDMAPRGTDFALSVPFTAYIEPEGTPILRITGNLVNLNAEATLTGYLVSLE